MAGFSPRVRLLVRTRAGSGWAGDACCEACGIVLGEHGGHLQHRLARGRGGSRNPVVASASNAALMCVRCHWRAESRDPEYRMEARGFVIRHGKGAEFDPRHVPLILLGGVKRWLGEDGKYHDEPPSQEAA